MILTQLSPTYYPVLFEVAKVTDSWTKRTYEEFCTEFAQYGGWVVEHNGTVIGYIMLYNGNWVSTELR